MTAIVLVAILGLCGWAIAGQVQAWRHLSAGRLALEGDEVQTARSHLAYAVRAWPSSGEVRFLAGRAARRCGEFDEAHEHLKAAAQLGWVEQAIELERALLRAQQGELPAVEPYLLRCVELEHPDSALILEILTPAYLSNFQMKEANGCIERWLELRPESAIAWSYQGALLERRMLKDKAVEAYRQAVRFDPSRRNFRLALVRNLFRANRPAEAKPHLEELLEQSPEDADVQVQLAQCLEGLGQREQAIRLLDEVLARHSDHGQALHLRGKIELERGQPRQAAIYLRRAVARLPFERELLYTWLRCLQRAGTAEEVKSVQKRLKECEAELDRLKKLTREIPSRPTDPELRFQVGAIHLRNGQEEEGIRWLRSALVAKPDHVATHRLLAESYQRRGQLDLAAQHRRMAEQVSTSMP